jgi:colicin import membrane protein
MSAIKQETAGGAPYHVPPEPKRWPAIGLAVGVHALLLAFLAIGVSWQNHEPVAVEAEVWDVKTEVAAPPPPPPQPEPEPQPETPPPEPQPVPKVAPPPPVEQPAPPKQPDIALEREKKRKEELKKQQKLEEERLERERELAEQKAEEKKAEEKKAKALADKKAREEAEKKAEELAKKEEAEKKKKADKEKADKLAKAKADKAEQARLDKLRAAEMKRMMAAADNVGTGSTGSAEKSSGPRRDNGYIAAITAKVKGNSAYGGDLDQPGNPTVTFHVEQLPTGEIISVRKTRSSGIPAFDDAVEKAINKSSPLPKKKDGTVERSLEINFHMKDMQ